MPPTDPEALPTVLHRSALLAKGLTADEIQRSRRNGHLADTGARRLLRCRHRVEPDQRTTTSAPRAGPGHPVAAPRPQPHLGGGRPPAPALGRPELRTCTSLGSASAVAGRRRDGSCTRAILAPSEIITVSGVRVTSMARTLVDIACTESLASDSDGGRCGPAKAMGVDVRTAEALDATGHRRGAAAARRALRFADGRAESAGESVIRVTMQSQLRLPPPTLQIRIYSPDGTFLGRVDLGYPGTRSALRVRRIGQVPQAISPGAGSRSGRRRREDPGRPDPRPGICGGALCMGGPRGSRGRARQGRGGTRPRAAGHRERGLAGTWSADPAFQIGS